MKIEEIRYADGELHLRVDPRDGMQAAYKLKPGDYEIVKATKKRSINANAYAWALINKISEAVRIPPIEVYREAVRNTGGVIGESVCIREEAAPAFIQTWERGHLGRQCNQYPSDTPGYVILECIYGSSDYDRKQMAGLIDVLVQDAQAIGIETKDPGDIESLLKTWRAGADGAAGGGRSRQRQSASVKKTEDSESPSGFLGTERWGC